MHSGVSIGLKAFEILVGIFFVFATAANWIFERERTIGFVASLLPRPKRKVMRDTWTLIDLKLGAFVRGQALGVLGDAVGLSPLLVLISVTAVGILFGGFAVVLAVPLAALLVTLVDVIVRDKDPAEEDMPTVLFPAKEAEN